jgi:peptide/nickel transport system ATP-binding protein
MADTNDLLLEVRDLATHFFLHEGIVRAVAGVSFDISRGRTLGIIGESGCGKSVTAQSILRIVPSPPGKIVGGEILLHWKDGEGNLGVVNLAQLNPRGPEIRRVRGKEISMIFQEPMTSFGPLHTIGNQIIEAIRLHQEFMDEKQARELTIQLLKRVGIPRPDQHLEAYPHQLSGGMRQRAMIAMALSCRPSLLIADEPTTALDVTIQAQILELLRHLRDELNMAIMFITHNLGVIAEIADEVAVMYLGRIVEQASVVEIFDHPRHPYTQALMKSIPRIDQRSGSRLPAIEGVVPDPYEIPRGCPFGDRCPRFEARVCTQAVPSLVELEKGHFVRCYLYSENEEEGR